tara:strand:+ start:16327 stop:17121 length:795 start_codon:yes stop_codon:yes gene_type:complete
MAITWTTLKEGDAISADSLNNKFESVKAEINDLQQGDIQPYALGQQHLPSMVLDAQSQVIAGAGTIHTYDNSSDVYPGFFNSTAAPDNWTVLNDGSSDLKVNFSNTWSLDNENVRGVLVMANIQVRIAKSQYTVYASTGIHPIFIIQAVNSAGDTVSVQKSERFTSSEVLNHVQAPASSSGTSWVASPAAGLQRALYKDVAIRTFITSAELAAYASTELGISAVQVGCGLTSQFHSSGPTDVEMGIGRCTLSAIVFKAGGTNFG